MLPKELYRFVTTRLVLTGAPPSFYLPSNHKEVRMACQAEESFSSSSKEGCSCNQVYKRQQQQNNMPSREQLKYNIKKN
jgi:hypothetical protein